VIRVTHVIPSMDASTGGPPVAVLGWSRGLRELGDSSTIVTTSLAGLPGWRAGETNSRAPRLPVGHESEEIRIARATPPYRIAYSRRLRRVLEQSIRRSDVVHVHTLYLYPTYAACSAARRLGVPLVVSPHGALDPYILRHGRFQKRLTDILWQRRALDEADWLIVATQEEGELIRPLGLRAPVAVVPLGLELDTFALAADGRREPFPHVIVNHGRLAPKKSLDVLIESLPIIHRTVPGVRLRLIGPDPHGVARDLRSRAEGLGVAGFVDILGPMYGDELARSVASATLWVLPSASENFGIAVAEAMAAGVPVIVSAEVNLAAAALAAGACRVASREPERLARSIVELLAAPEARRDLSVAGRGFAATFTTARAAGRLHDVYLGAIAHRGRVA
jgi:glycosyltransferase involved in cell wall biosynthesis